MKVFLVFLIALSLTSCTSHVDREAVVGKYILNNNVVDSLKLKPDGIYYQNKFQYGRSLSNSGTWHLNSTGNEILFKNFSFLSYGSGSGNWYSKVKVENNVIHLIYSSEEDIHYKKID